MGLDPLDAHEHVFHLRREDVHAADDEHVVGAAGDLVHAHQGAAAAAGLEEQPGDVLGAVADEREGLLGQGGEHQFAGLAAGQRFQGLRVDHLGQEVVLENVHAALRVEAFHAHARADDLGQAVDVQRLDTQLALHLLAHVLAPRLGPVDAHPQFEIVRGDAGVAHGVGQVEGVGRGGHEHGGAEVAHDGHLAPGVAAGHRDDRGAEGLDAVVGAEAAGEQAVAVGVVHHVAAGDPGHHQAAGDDRGPQGDVRLGVADHGGLAGGARTGVHADDVVHGGGEQPEGVVVAQVVLGGVGQVAQVGEAADVHRLDPGRVHLRPVGGHPVVHPLHQQLQPAQLNGLQPLAGQGFDLFPVHRFPPGSVGGALRRRPPPARRRRRVC